MLTPVKIDKTTDITKLTKLLNHKNKDVKLKVIEKLSSIGNKHFVIPLIKSLNDSDKYVRFNAARVLGELGDTEAVDPLIEKLSDKDFDVRREIATSLGKLKDIKSINPLVKLLSDSEWGVRNNAVYALGELGNKQALTPLLKALDDSHANVRKQVVCALGKIGDPRSLYRLFKALNDSNFIVRVEVAFSLGKIGDSRAVNHLIKTLEDSEPKVRLVAIDSLGTLGDKHAITPLINLLADQLEIRKHAVLILEKLGEPKWMKIIMGNDSDFERLGKCGDSRVVYTLIKFLPQYNYLGKQLIASALGNTGDVKAFAPLLELLRDDPDHDVKRSAESALYKLANKKNVNNFIQVLNRKHNWIIRNIEKDLYQTEPSERIICLAIDVLGRIGDVQAIVTLINVLTCQKHVRLSAAKALQKLGEPRWKEIILGQPDDWKRLEECRDIRVVDPLFSSTSDKSSDMYAGASLELGKRGDRRVISNLAYILSQKFGYNPYEVDTEILKNLLLKYGSIAIETLREYLGGKGANFSYDVADVLKKLGDKDYVDENTPEYKSFHGWSSGCFGEYACTD